MPEAEEVITDVARHTTIYVQNLWRRHRKDRSEDNRVILRDVVQRLDLLVVAIFGTSYPIRVAQKPPPPTFLTKVLRHDDGPRIRSAVPATDGKTIWLPLESPELDKQSALEWYRVMVLQQAMRAHRRSADFLDQMDDVVQKAIYEVIEAHCADLALMRILPGMSDAIRRYRSRIVEERPEISTFPAHRRPIEEFIRSLLSTPESLKISDSPKESVVLAHEHAARIYDRSPELRRRRALLYRDPWIGELRAPVEQAALSNSVKNEGTDQSPKNALRSATLERRPEVRDSRDDEDDAKQGAWMVQTSAPHEQAEDPFGMQRPTDRDESTAAEEFADSLSELPEARLVSTPGRPKEVLLSDDVPASRTKQARPGLLGDDSTFRYPEWDCKTGAYLDPGVTVRSVLAEEGPQAWVDTTLDTYRTMLDVVRRRFEMLRAQRMRLRMQFEGEDIDLEAYIEGHADFRAGLPMPQAIYQTYRPAKRDVAILLLIDISGSTDGWISSGKRVIDVEREALLLVSTALESMREPYCIQAFSGEGPHGVVVRTVKSFSESYGPVIARRIASLEPEHYTRAGAAIRHASGTLMRQPARHRLLVLLSDGKPNDIDDYEGRYGVEDMRQAINEAKLQGIHPFCLTIDRQAAAYLPRVFGMHQYALLKNPTQLPLVLLDWMKRLIAA